MIKNIFKALGIFTLVLLVMSITGAASSCSSSDGNCQMDENQKSWNSLSNSNDKICEYGSCGNEADQYNEADEDNEAEYNEADKDNEADEDNEVRV